MSQDDGKSDFLSLDPPLTLSPPLTSAPKKQPARQDETFEPVLESTGKLPPAKPVVVAPVQPPQPEFVLPATAPIPVPVPAPAPAAAKPPAPAQTPSQPPVQAPIAAAPVSTPVSNVVQQPVAPPQADEPTVIDDDDDVIIIDDDGEPVEPAAQAPVSSPAPEPEPAEPPPPPSLDELAAANDNHADLADAFSQVASSNAATPTAASVLRQTRKSAEDSSLKKNAVPILFTIGSICFAIGGWALMAKLGVIKFEGVDADAVKNHDMKVMIGLASIPVGILLILASIYMGIQVYGKKPDPKPKRK